MALTQVSHDIYTDAQAQHNTEVEPDTFTFGSTIVSAFQVGRVFGGGASNVGWATSTNGGATWTHGYLPGITTNAGGTFGQVSDASVTFDYMPDQFVTFRGEWNYREANVPYFSGPGGVTPVGGNTGDPSAIVPNFTPDLRKRETRFNFALLVKF